jgi:nucleotide-binding universal stress UspA family protein
MSIFPTKILLATDGSEKAELAKSTGSELHVVVIFQESAYGHPYYEARFPEFAEQLRQQDREETQKVLDAQVNRLQETGVDIAEAHLRTGEPERKIIVLSEELRAGLIVTGSRGLGGVRRALLGSVSDSVVRHAHCPVLVVRSVQERGHH